MGPIAPPGTTGAVASHVIPADAAGRATMVPMSHPAANMTIALLTRIAQVETESDNEALESFLEDHGMLVGTVVMLVAVGVGLGMLYGAMVRNRRVRTMVPTAAAAGLQYSLEDRFGSTDIAFPLFRAGDGRRVENVMWREGSNGMPVRVMDYSYYDEYKDENGRIHKRWSHFSCAMARHNGLWPTIRVTRERALDKAVQKLGLPDIELESEEFNRTFVVLCEDRKFATDLLAPEMMELLLTTRGLVDLETKGRWMLLTASRLDKPSEMVGLLNLADQILTRIPPVIWDLYPEAPDSEHGLSTIEGLPDLGLLDPVQSVADAMREEQRAATPEIEFDLDGRPVNPREERPWD